MEHINEKKIREILENYNKGEKDEAISVFLKAASNYTLQIAEFINPYSAAEEAFLLAALYACAQAIEKKWQWEIRSTLKIPEKLLRQSARCCSKIWESSQF